MCSIIINALMNQLLADQKEFQCKSYLKVRLLACADFLHLLLDLFIFGLQLELLFSDAELQLSVALVDLAQLLFQLSQSTNTTSASRFSHTSKVHPTKP